MAVLGLHGVSESLARTTALQRDATRSPWPMPACHALRDSSKKYEIARPDRSDDARELARTWVSLTNDPRPLRMYKLVRDSSVLL